MDKIPEKLWKKNIREQQKRIRPGECQKYVRLVMDSRVKAASYGKDLIAGLNNAAVDLRYEIRPLPIKEILIWERNMGQLALQPDKVNTLSDVWQKENQVVKILESAELTNLIKAEKLYSIVEDFNQHFPDKQHIVLFLSTQEKHPSAVASALIEIQVMYQIKILKIEPSTKEFVNQLQRLTKAVAEVPHKKQKSEILDTFKKFLANDKKQCVRVEGTNGLGRLWQQHLNRLPLVTLEVAETIIDKYSCPKKLMDDLENNNEAIKEIADLKIKRSGPVALQTERRIGNVLSCKMNLLYTSKDPTTLI